MNLVIDIGNTRAKIALFSEQNKIVFSEAFCSIKLKDIKQIEKREAKIDRVIFSLVGERQRLLKKYKNILR